MSKKKVKRVGSSSRQLLVRAAELEKLTQCAREHVRMAKLDLKQARQALKLAKKAAKRARKEARAAGFTRKKLAKVQTARAEAKGLRNSAPGSLQLFQNRTSVPAKTTPDGPSLTPNLVTLNSPSTPAP